MSHLLTGERRDRTDQCPRCGSHDLRTFFDIEIDPDGAYFDDCGNCDWSSHPGYEYAEDRDPIVICEAELHHALRQHEAWVLSGNESMIAFTAASVAALEQQISKLRSEAGDGGEATG
jgi:hypothetical protein